MASLARLGALALILPLVGPAALPAQATPLRPAVDTLNVWVVRGGDTLPAGIIIDDLRIVAHDSGARFVRVYTTRSPLLPSSVDTIVDAIEGLRPIRSVSVHGDSVYRLDFSPSRVRGDLRIGAGIRRPIDLALPAEVISASSLDLRLRSSLLHIGDSVRAVVFTPTVYGGVASVAVRIDGEEEAEDRRSWRLVGVFPPGNRVTFWIDQESRALVRQRLELPTGVTVLLNHRIPERRLAPRRAA